MILEWLPLTMYIHKVVYERGNIMEALDGLTDTNPLLNVIWVHIYGR